MFSRNYSCSIFSRLTSDSAERESGEFKETYAGGGGLEFVGFREESARNIYNLYERWSGKWKYEDFGSLA